MTNPLSDKHEKYVLGYPTLPIGHPDRGCRYKKTFTYRDNSRVGVDCYHAGIEVETRTNYYSFEVSGHAQMHGHTSTRSCRPLRGQILVILPLTCTDMEARISYVEYLADILERRNRDGPRKSNNYAIAWPEQSLVRLATRIWHICAADHMFRFA